MVDVLDRDGLEALAKQLGRPMSTLYVLNWHNDPFMASQSSRLAMAEWFAQVWNDLGVGRGFHLRRIHYAAISQDPPILMPSGKPYINTQECADFLGNASLDARYLCLVPADDLVDRRNDEPIIYLPNDAASAGLHIAGGLLENELSGFEVPKLRLIRPTILQRFHVEIWCEKTTMNDVLLPLCELYGINLVTGSGELSLTACVNVVKRAEESGCPVRILYVSDFDPAGASMPVAVARKIEHLLYVMELRHLDIQVRPIVLTHEQCIRYRLPRTPIKASEGRAGKFEARFGEGATELDALEALRPGELRHILLHEIERYYDADLDDDVRDVAAEVETDLDAVNAAVSKKHAKAIAELEAEQKKLAAAIKAFEKKAKPILRKIEKDLEAEAPDVDAYDWPEPDEGDEDDDPLFDSTRDYVEQIDRYKEHQGKPTTGKPRMTHQFTACLICGEPFTAKRRDALFCSTRCKNRHQENKRKGVRKRYADVS
jgi:hypothetical protein